MVNKRKKKTMSRGFLNRNNHQNSSSDNDFENQKKIDPEAQLNWINNQQVDSGFGVFNLPVNEQGKQPAQMFAKEEEEEPIQTKSKNINSDTALEKEADLMGKKATQFPAKGKKHATPQTVTSNPGVIQGIFGLGKLKRLFKKKSPEEKAIDDAEKRANIATKNHKRKVRRMKKLHGKYVHVLMKGNYDRADVLHDQFQRASDEEEIAREEADVAVNDFVEKVSEQHEKISELISRPLVEYTAEELQDIEDELDQNEQQGEQTITAIATEAEKAKEIKSEVINIKEKTKERPAKEEEFEQFEFTPEEIDRLIPEEEEEFEQFELTPEEIELLPKSEEVIKREKLEMAKKELEKKEAWERRARAAKEKYSREASDVEELNEGMILS